MYAYIFSTEERMKWQWFHNPDTTLSTLNICYFDDKKHEFSLNITNNSDVIKISVFHENVVFNLP